MKTTEKVVVECKTHWIKTIIPAIFTIIFLISTLNYLFSGMFGDFFIMLILTAICAGIILIELKANYLRMTETAIIGRVGFIRTRKMASPISKVQDVGVDSGLLGKILGYSTVHISTAGSSGSEYVFKCVKNGKKLQNAFLERSK